MVNGTGNGEEQDGQRESQWHCDGHLQKWRHEQVSRE